MTSDEILMRLRVLVEMPHDKRPISIAALERLAKVAPKYIYVMVHHHERINGSVRRRLSRALTLVENGQVQIEPQMRNGGKNKNNFTKQEIRVLDSPNPPQCIARRITFGNDGKPKVVSFVFNPAALQK